MRFDHSTAIRMRLEPESADSRSVRVVSARSLSQRALGLMGRELARLPSDGGVLFDRCRCIHTFGMRGPIAVAWVGRERADGTRAVISIDASIPPCRVVAGPRGAAAALEMPPMDPEVESDPPVRLEAR